MIHDLMKILERELGHPLPDGSAHRVEAELCQQYGGERVYVPKQPKLVNMVRMQSIGTAEKTQQLAKKIGKSVWTVRRLRRP